jgi:hypothetical protein
MIKELSDVASREIARSRMTLAEELPERAGAFPIWSYQCHPVTVFAYRTTEADPTSCCCSPTTNRQKQLLSEVAKSYEQFKGQEAEIIAVVRCSKDECDGLEQQLNLPYRIRAKELL